MSIHDKDLLTGMDKVQTAIKRIQSFCAGKRVLVAFSGGKDSQCCYHLAKMAKVPFSAQYSVTRFEPPELLRFIREHYPDVIFRRVYRRSLIEDIARNGLPSRWSRWCCDCKHRKTEGFDIAVIGIRAAESARRKARWTVFGQKQDRTYYVCPIIDWTNADVWEFLNENNLPHCSLYDKGFKRIGCVCCPLAPGKGDEKRWPKFAAALKVGFIKALERNDIKNEKTNEVHAKYRTDPDHHFQNWLKHGSTEDINDDLPENYPCLFAGTGFSESDGEKEATKC